MRRPLTPSAPVYAGFDDVNLPWHHPAHPHHRRADDWQMVASRDSTTPVPASFGKTLTFIFPWGARSVPLSSETRESRFRTREHSYLKYCVQRAKEGHNQYLLRLFGRLPYLRRRCRRSTAQSRRARQLDLESQQGANSLKNRQLSSSMEKRRQAHRNLNRPASPRDTDQVY